MKEKIDIKMAIKDEGYYLEAMLNGCKYRQFYLSTKSIPLYAKDEAHALKMFIAHLKKQKEK